MAGNHGFPSLHEGCCGHKAGVSPYCQPGLSAAPLHQPLWLPTEANSLSEMFIYKESNLSKLTLLAQYPLIEQADFF